jgi:hypothetical protein
VSGASRLEFGLLDAVLAVFVVPAALYLKPIRRVGVFRLPLSKKVLFPIGVFPIRDHDYEPQFDNRHPKPPFSDDRRLPGIDWNLPGQLALLDRFTYAGELTGIPSSKPAELAFHFNNRNFESGDAEFWYQMIRTVKSKRIFEIGSGSSTLMAVRATRENQRETGLSCRHVCVEPYEMPWLEQTGITIVRSKVEDLDPLVLLRTRRRRHSVHRLLAHDPTARRRALRVPRPVADIEQGRHRPRARYVLAEELPAAVTGRPDPLLERAVPSGSVPVAQPRLENHRRGQPVEERPLRSAEGGCAVPDTGPSTGLLLPAADRLRRARR